MGKKHKKNTINRICVECGKVFNAKSKSEYLCKKCYLGECRKYLNLELTTKPRHLYTRTCPQCSNEFTTNNINQKYCCEKHREEYYAERKPLGQKDYMISREDIFKRDEYKCIYCGKSSIEDGVKLHLEHIYPISKGGSGDLFNLATSCERCNSKKSAIMLPKEMILRIWERNEKFNEKIEVESFDKLREIFEKNVEMRKNPR